ncbi:MAG TPA: DUF3347 domain-containing protein [Chitinophagaceae bacterium]
MRKFSVVLLVIVVVFAAWRIFFRDKSHTDEPKQQPLKVTVHSGEFNKSIAAVVTQYLSLKDAFVNADTSTIKAEEKKLITVIDSIKIDELKKDTTGIFQSAQAQLSDIISNADAILKETDITEMRQDFRMVSENLFPLLKTIHYEGVKLYWQNCPMAFGESKDANWISSTEEIFNPYLGKNHPEFKGTMLHCGEIKDTIQ